MPTSIAILLTFLFVAGLLAWEGNGFDEEALKADFLAAWQSIEQRLSKARIEALLDEPLTTADTDVVASFYDESTDFASKRTYAMPDSVVHVGESEEISRQFDQQILGRITQNLQTLGYTEAATPEEADVHVLPFLL